MRISCPEQMIRASDWNEVFTILGAVGVDGIDCRFESLTDRVFADNLGEYGLPLASVYSQIREPSLLEAHVSDRARAVNEVVSRARTAQEFGAVNMILVPVFGAPRFRLDLSESELMEVETGEITLLMQEIGSKLANDSIKVVLEPLNRQETHFLTDPTLAADICERVASPVIRTMVDTYHCFMEGQNPSTQIRNVGGHLQLVHASDSERGLPGEGQVDFSSVLSTLVDVGYEGWIGLECRSIESETDVSALRNSVALLRQLGKDSEGAR